MRDAIQSAGEMLLKEAFGEDVQKEIRKQIDSIMKNFNLLENRIKTLAVGDFDEDYNKILDAFNSFDDAYKKFKNNLETEINTLTAELYKGNYNPATIAKGEKNLELAQTRANIKALRQNIQVTTKALAGAQYNTNSEEEAVIDKKNELTERLEETKTALSSETLKEAKLQYEIKKEAEELKETLEEYQFEIQLQLKQMQIDLQKAKSELEQLRLDNKYKLLLEGITDADFKSFIEAGVNLIKVINEAINKRLEQDKKRLEDQKKIRDQQKRDIELAEKIPTADLFKDAVLQSTKDLDKIFKNSFTTLEKVIEKAGDGIKRLVDIIESVFKKFNINIKVSNSSIEQTFLQFAKVGLGIEKNGLNISSFNNKIVKVNDSLSKTVFAFKYINDILRAMPSNPTITINGGNIPSAPTRPSWISSISSQSQNQFTSASSDVNNSNLNTPNTSVVSRKPGFDPDWDRMQEILGVDSTAEEISSNPFSQRVLVAGRPGYTQKSNGIPLMKVPSSDAQILYGKPQNFWDQILNPINMGNVNVNSVKWLQNQMWQGQRDKFTTFDSPIELARKINASLKAVNQTDRSGKRFRVDIDPSLGQAAELTLDTILPSLSQNEREPLLKAIVERRNNQRNLFGYDSNDQNRIKQLQDISQKYLLPPELQKYSNINQAVANYIQIIVEELKVPNSLKDGKPSRNLKAKAQNVLKGIDAIASQKLIKQLKHQDSYDAIKELAQRDRITVRTGGHIRHLVPTINTTTQRTQRTPITPTTQRTPITPTAGGNNQVPRRNPGSGGNPGSVIPGSVIPVSRNNSTTQPISTIPVSTSLITVGGSGNSPKFPPKDPKASNVPTNSNLEAQQAIINQQQQQADQQITLEQIDQQIKQIELNFQQTQQNPSDNTTKEINSILSQLRIFGGNQTAEQAGEDAARERKQQIDQLLRNYSKLKTDFENRKKAAQQAAKDYRDLLKRLPSLNLPQKEENKLRTQINQLIKKYNTTAIQATTDLKLINQSQPEIDKLRKDAMKRVPEYKDSVVNAERINTLLAEVETRLSANINRRNELEKIKGIRILTQEEQEELVRLNRILIGKDETIKEYLQTQLAIINIEPSKLTGKIKVRKDNASKKIKELFTLPTNVTDEVAEALKRIEQDNKESVDAEILDKYKPRVKTIGDLNFQKDNLSFEKEILELIGDTRGVGNIDQRLAILDQRLKIQEDLRLSPNMLELLNKEINIRDQRAKDEIKRQATSNISDAAIQMFETSGMPTFQLNAIKRERAIQEAKRKAQKERQDNNGRQQILIQLANDRYNEQTSSIDDKLQADIAENPELSDKLKRDAQAAQARIQQAKDTAISQARDEAKTESTRITREETAAIETANIAHKDFIATLRSDIVAAAKDSLGSELSTFLMQDLVIGVDAVTGQVKDLSNELRGLERVLYNVTKAILNSIIQLATKTFTDGIVNWFASILPGAPKITNKALGGVVKNYAEGGLASSINAAFIKERSMNGGIQPVLAALTPGERVLTVEQNKRFEQLQLDKVVNYANGGMISPIDSRVLNYANGGMVSTAEKQYHQTMNYVNGGYVAPPINTEQNTVNNQKPENTFNIPITIQSNSGKDESNIDPNQLRNAVQSAVLTEIQRQQRQGGILPRR